MTEALELDLTQSANLNITTAKPLFDKLINLNKNTKLISNGVMYDLFKQCRGDRVSVAPEIRILEKPIIGMIGVLRHGYDFKLIEDIMRKKSEWSFVFVGEIAENARNTVEYLSKYNNFHIFGWRPYDELLSFLKGFSVAIIPYIVNDWTNTINPNKVYDYFSAGVPVVATPIHELYKRKECLTLCENKNEFIKGIDRILLGEAKDKTQKAIDMAKALSWDSIANEVILELRGLI